MADTDTVRGWKGRTMIDRDGGYIGSIDDIYADDRTGQPEWALVSTGLAGTKLTFVPIAQATTSGNDVQVPYQKKLVKDAPGIAPDRQLSAPEEQQLFRHYGLDYGAGHPETPTQGPRGTTDVGLPASAWEAGDDTNEPAASIQRGTGRDASGQTTDDAMTRSEEELRVGTQARERGRVRLRKYVATEQVQQTIPVQREKVRLEVEPISDASVDATTRGPNSTDPEHEVVLHEEQPVVEKRVVPKERVRLDKEAVTDQQQVAEEVRKERIDVDDQRERGPRG